MKVDVSADHEVTAGVQNKLQANILEGLGIRSNQRQRIQLATRNFYQEKLPWNFRYLIYHEMSMSIRYHNWNVRYISYIVGIDMTLSGIEMSYRRFGNFHC